LLEYGVFFFGTASRNESQRVSKKDDRFEKVVVAAGIMSKGNNRG